MTINNEKGLAEQWTMDFGYGVINVIMYYDEKNRLIRAEEDFFGAGNYEYIFYYDGKRLRRLTRTNVDFPEDALDFTYTYNSKGQNTRQDDNIHDQHVLMYYDAMGNCTQTDLYFGSDLIFSDIYTFNIPARNPKAFIPGVETGFPFYGTAGVTDKWWFSSNKTIIYDNGNPILFNDYDPDETIIETGTKNLPSTAGYYDRVTETNIDITFDYDNCGGSSSRPYVSPFSRGNKSFEANKTARDTRPMITLGSLRSMKDQVQKLREQNKSRIK